MSIIANLDILLGARTEKLDRGFDRSTAKVKKFESDVHRMGKAAEATLAPLKQLGQGILASIPGASAAATAFAAIAAAFAGGIVAKVAKDTAATAVASAASAVTMTEFATAAAAAAVATGDISQNFDVPTLRVPRIGSRDLSTDTRPSRNDGVLDAEFRVLDNVPAKAGEASAAIAGIGPVGIAAGAAVAAAFVGIGTAALAARVTIRGVREQLGQIDEIAKSASKAGVTFEQLASFRLAAAEAGLGPQQADKAIVKMQISLSEAKRTGGALADQLKTLGLDAGRLLQDGPISAMQQLATATAGMKSPTDQLVLAYKLFGEEGVAVLNVLKGGPDQLKAAGEAAVELGLTLSQAQAKQVEAANDAWGRMELVATGVFRQIAAESAPVLEAIANTVESIARDFAGWEQALAPTIDSFIIALGMLKEVVSLSNGWLGLLSSFPTQLAIDTDFDFADKVQAARDKASAAGALPAPVVTESPDLSAVEARLEADKAMADSAKRTAEERARSAQQNRDAVRERLGTLREEIATLRLGAEAVERMKLARQGATAQQLRGFDAMTREKQQLEQITDAMERGKQLREQFATPQQQLNKEMQDLHQLLNVGAIDFGTFARAARDAAGRLDKPDKKRSADTPTFGALQKGSVEAFSAALRNDKAGKTEALQKEGNTHLKNINIHIERVAQRLQVQTMGAV